MLMEAVGAAPTLPYTLFWVVWLVITVGGISIVALQTRRTGPRRWLILVPVAASAVLLFTMALIAADCHSVGPVGRLYSPSRCTENHPRVGYAVLAGCVAIVVGVIIYAMYRNTVSPPPESDE
ncbi:MAG: hypothetical protein MUQ27_04560 [Acidimicrobiia bacterium]|nr:hypothetical protein [Acidimicrobiia bacterium]